MSVGSVDMESIIKKAKQHMATKQRQDEIWDITDKYMIKGIPVAKDGPGQQLPACDAANIYSLVFKNTINDVANEGLLGEAAVDTLKSISAGDTQRVGREYYVHAYLFTGGLHRDSLMPERYDGVDNIVKLLNNGYMARRSVFGMWHGEPIWSKQVRTGAHFIERAESKFRSKYPDFGVVDIETHYIDE